MLADIASNQNIRPDSFLPDCPPAADRRAWEGLPEDLKTALVTEGERFLHFSYPLILATDYMEFCRNGNRTHYEDKQFARRIALSALVMAECVEYQGRFLDDIVNGIFLICEESGWQLPAHNSYERDKAQRPLPDVTRPVIDLFAAETGAVVGVAEYLLRDALASVSPAVSALVNFHLKNRIFIPYLSEHFWWMGDGRTSVNNWTPWCTQNVLLAAFSRAAAPDAADLKTEIFRKACQSLDYFLDEYDEDGCCDEGAQYYRHAALTFFNAAEILNHITDGGFSEIYRLPKIFNMAAYILNVHVAGPYYVNFADCSPIAGHCGAREYLFGKRTRDQNLMAFAAADYRSCDARQRLMPEEHNLFYRVQSAFSHREMLEAGSGGGKTAVSASSDAGNSPMDGSPAASAAHPDIFYPSVGLFIARDEHFCLAVKAGDNDDSHNHNDTGSFIIYKDGKPLFIDIGVESYTKKTFSSRRYEIWTMQSCWHNLPTIGGVTQKDGPQYAARDVVCLMDSSCPSISMDIADAYPDGRILSCVRKAALEKGRGITIRDTFRLAEPMEITLSLITRQRPEFFETMPAESADPARAESGSDSVGSDSAGPADRFRLSEAVTADAAGTALPKNIVMQIGGLARCSVRGAVRAKTEEIPITDPRLGIAWKGSIYRTLLTVSGTECALEIV